MGDRYFVAYAYENAQGVHASWSEVAVERPIRDGDDIKALEKHIRQLHDLTSVTITNFRRFDTA